MPLFHQNVGRERRLTQTLHTGKYRYLPLQLLLKLKSCVSFRTSLHALAYDMFLKLSCILISSPDTLCSGKWVGIFPVTKEVFISINAHVDKCPCPFIRQKSQFKCLCAHVCSFF